MNDMDKLEKREALSRLAEQAVPDSLDLWPRVRAQAGARPASAFPGGMRRRIAVGLTAALLLVLLAAGAASLWYAATPVSAQAILDQAQSAALSPMTAVHSYHLKLTRTVAAKGNVTIESEIWYGGSDRQRSHVQTKDAGGVLQADSEIVFGGPEVWIANTAKGQTQVIHTTGTTWNSPLDDPSRQNSLTDAITSYTNPKACTSARLQAESSVLGQATYVIEVLPLAGGCAPAASGPTPAANARPGPPAKTDPGPGAGRGSSDNQVGQMLVWIDKVSFLPLKTEVRNPAGVLLEQALVTSVEYNVPIPDSVFTYTVPAGASVSNFTGGDGADVKAKLCGNSPASRCQPSK